MKNTSKPRAGTALDKARASIVTAGNGRGFVVRGREGRFVITAAHCLPYLPPCMGMMHLEEKTYQNFLGPLGQQPSVWAECLFVNPVADIAVLGSPDNQTFFDQSDAYKEFIESVTPIKITEAQKKGCGWLFSLERKWFSATLEYIN